MNKNLTFEGKEEFESILGEGVNTANMQARAAFIPIASASVGGDYSANTDGLELKDALKEVSRQADLLLSGNMGNGEKMLLAQAIALDSIFCNLATLAKYNINKVTTVKELQGAEIYLKLAIRAQSQCSATWEVISKVKLAQSLLKKRAQSKPQIKQSCKIAKKPPVLKSVNAKKS